jgi:type IX secretion system PorP/SprF family membrane protein
MFNMIHVNPAYAGYRGSSSLALVCRNQWAGLKGAPKTGSATWNDLSEDSRVGYGAGIYYDQLGIEKTSGVQGYFAYHVPFENAYLSLGLSGGILNYRAMYSESELFNPGDPLFAHDVNGWLPTAGFGALYVTENWFVSFSVPALLHTKIDVQNSLNQNAFGASNHYFLTAGYVFLVSDDIKIRPSFMIKAVKGSALQYDVNANWWFRDQLGFGLSYRQGDAIVSLFQLQIADNMRLGYAYDYSLSDISAYHKGSHELFLRYELPRKNGIACRKCINAFE